MARFNVSEIAKAVGAKVVTGDEATVRGVAIDSRKALRGSLFIAIKGDRYDGHNFVRQAFDNGAVAVLVSRRTVASSFPGKRVILVDDTVKALADLAGYHRSRFRKLLVIGVTGSNGKTTVKDMIALILSQKYKTLKTEGNLNNQIGAPLTLLRLNKSHEAAVIEMGMNSPGEIAALARIARPSIGVITNIGPAHLEGLKTVANVRRAKAELLKNLGSKGKAALNADDPNSRPLIRAGGKNMITFGRSESADINLVDTWVNGKIGYRAVFQSGKIEQEIHVPLLGRHNIENALAASAVSIAAGVDTEDIARGLKKIKPAKMRMELSTIPNGALVINDAYNANPDSVEAALDCASEYKKEGKLFFVFGDMLEMGIHSRSAHKKIAKIAKRAGVDIIFALGAMASVTAKEASRLGIEAVVRKSSQALANAIWRKLSPSDTILVKGSRAMAMERSIDYLTERLKG